MTITSRTLPVAVAYLLLSGAAVFADNKSDAKHQIERAMKANAENRVDEALAAFSAAYALDPQPELLYAIGQMNVKLDRCADAITAYQKFIDTKPKPGPAGKAREAIDVCKKRLEAEAPPPPTEPPPGPTPPAEPPAAPPTEPTIAPVTTADAKPEAPPEAPVLDDKPAGPPRWYTDPLGGVLVVGGVVGIVAGIVFYRSSSADLDAAEKAPTYQDGLDQIDSAHRTRTISLVAGGTGALLLGVGVARYLTLDRGGDRGVAIAPRSGGGIVVWSGRF